MGEDFSGKISLGRLLCGEKFFWVAQLARRCGHFLNAGLLLLLFVVGVGACQDLRQQHPQLHHLPF